MNGYSNGGTSTTTLTTTINGTASTPPARSPFNFKQMPMAPPTNVAAANQQAVKSTSRTSIQEIEYKSSDLYRTQASSPVSRPLIATYTDI
ncbi:hypothetical protein ABW20_dc0101433 [Dactylellina cionopaga]|nr:hypothetical protein ABW20_dc0101433 [Dactylellina cionopaga]